MDGLITWLEQLPPLALYVALGLAAAVENIFPPLPTDTLVALGGYLAARGEAHWQWAFASIFTGNLAGASAAYWAGRRLGAERVRSWILGPPKDEEKAEERLTKLYGTYGLGALFVARLVPAIRALVAPLAGALRVPFPMAITIMAVASGIWYGLIMTLTYRFASSIEDVVSMVTRSGRNVSLVVVGIAAVGGIAWWWRTRARSGAPQ